MLWCVLHIVIFNSSLRWCLVRTPSLNMVISTLNPSFHDLMLLIFIIIDITIVLILKNPHTLIRSSLHEIIIFNPLTP